MFGKSGMFFISSVWASRHTAPSTLCDILLIRTKKIKCDTWLNPDFLCSCSTESNCTSSHCWHSPPCTQLFSASCSAQRSAVSHFTVDVFVMQTGETMFTPTHTVARSFTFYDTKARNSTESVLACVTGLNWIKPPSPVEITTNPPLLPLEGTINLTQELTELNANAVQVHLITARLWSCRALH